MSVLTFSKKSETILGDLNEYKGEKKQKKETCKMKKWLFALVLVIISIPAMADGKSGVGFEFGTDYLTASNDYSGTGTFFILEFKLSDDIAFGYFKGDGTLSRTSGVATGSTTPAAIVSLKVATNAVQIKKAIVSDYIYLALRIGSYEVSASGIANSVFSQSNPFAGVFVRVVPLKKTTSSFDGAININLGYNFVPIKALSDGTTQGGTLNLLNSLLKDLNSFDIGISASVTF